jgi:hypothetical protein
VYWFNIGFIILVCECFIFLFQNFNVFCVSVNFFSLSERRIIRAISQGLISGKLDQLSRTVKISGAVSRTFGPKQWDSVAADIQVWLDAVKKVILLVNQSSGVQTK